MSNANQNAPRVPVVAGSTPSTPVSSSVSVLGQLLRERTTNTLWWHEIGGQANFYMSTKAFWLRSAAHYRDPYWRDVKAEMEALRNIKRINVRLRESINTK